MVQAGQITFYTNPFSPFCQRVLMALEETKAEYTAYNVDVLDKPAWFVEKVTSIGKVPVIAYGGPKAAPENPSPESEKINESAVILEFIADIFPEATLRPIDPLLRARARLFTTVLDTKVVDAFRTFFFARPASDPNADKALLDALNALQTRLPPSGFVAGEWSIADMAAAPILVLIELLLKNDCGNFPVGKGLEVWQALQAPQFARLLKYLEIVKAVPSFRRSWDEVAHTEFWRHNLKRT